MNQVTLTGAEIYTEINIAPAALAYKAGSKLEGQKYHVGRWGSRGFTVPEALFKLWDRAELQSLSIAESSYERMNDNTGKTETIQSATIMGYVTWEKAGNIVSKGAEHEVKIATAEIKTKHARRVAIADLNLSEKAEAELLAAI